MGNQTNKTNARQFNQFNKYVKKWIKLLHLESWTVYTEHSNDEDELEAGHISWIKYSYESQVAKIYFASEWPVAYTAKMSEMAAFHECFHLMFAPIEALTDDSALEEVMAKEEHLLIGTLEEIIFGKVREQKGFN